MDMQVEYAKLVVVPDSPFSVVGARLLTEMVSKTRPFQNDGTVTEDGVVFHYVVNRQKAEERYKVLIAGLDSYCATVHPG